MMRISTVEFYRKTPIYSGLPNAFTFEKTSDTAGVITLNANPDQAYTLRIIDNSNVIGFTDYTTAMAFPDGYERFLATALAVEIAPEFARPVSQELMQAYNDAKRSVFVANTRHNTIYASSEMAYNFRRTRSFNIMKGN